MNIYVDFTDPGAIIDIDGLNDFGIVLNNTINTLLAVARNRIVYMINA